jgi:hypothetical protein
MDIKHVGLEGLDQINIREDRDKLHAVVNMLIGLWVVFVA